MSRRDLFFLNLDKFWIYSGLFGFSLFLHYFTPYYEQQPVPNFVRSVCIAPLYEEFVFRFLGILLAYYCLSKITQSEPFYKKINWGMVFIISVYLELGMSFFLIEKVIQVDQFLLTLSGCIIYLGILLLINKYRLEIIVLVSSFSWAFIHESFRILAVFIAGIFFSILCINRSRISLLKNQNRSTIVFLLFYGAFIGYLIHFWNNLLNYALYKIVSPIFIDFLSLISVVIFLFILETYINAFIDEKCKIDLPLM